MSIKSYKPTTPSRRQMTVSGFDGIDKKAKPEPSLIESLKKSAGRNSYGHITVRHRGGGNKRKYRIIDFKRDKQGTATVLRLEYDPNRSANIALIQYEDGEKRYILAPVGMQIPKIDKIVVNVGCGEARENSKVLENVVGDLSKITGQKPIITKARKSIANFKLREEMPIGAKVTLRGAKMWEFLDRLFNVALPRVRDFQGINPNSFDGRGNYALGVKEQLIFPEIEYDKIDKIRGMDVVICTTARTDEEARALLEQVGAPFAK